MSPNSDNAMARFLFAILKQKNLKDIDWNLVAADPVLLQPISNGHAARMRYSRFRATVSGTESRSSSKSKSGDKTRVSKSKSKNGPIKCGADGTPITIKQEHPGSGSLYYSPASSVSPYLSDNRDDFSTRYATPCSDGYSVDPTVVEGPHINYSPSLNFMEPPAGLQSPTNDFTAFDEAAFNLTDFTTETQAGPLDDWNDRLQHQF